MPFARLDEKIGIRVIYGNEASVKDLFDANELPEWLHKLEWPVENRRAPLVRNLTVFLKNGIISEIHASYVSRRLLHDNIYYLVNGQAKYAKTVVGWRYEA